MVEFITQYGQENPVDDFQRFLKLMENSSFPMPIIKKDISGIIIKGLIDQNSINKEKRIFSGFGSVAIIDRQGDYLPIEEFKPVMEKLMQRGAPVTDSHSNHVVGKIVDYTYKPTPTGEMGLYLTAEIYNHYPTDAETWRKIQEGEYTGFSLGGKAGTKTPTCTNIGCYNILGNIEAWEFSIVERPANQLANIDKVNKLAKASDIIEEVVYSITKGRIYIKTPADAPRNAQVYTGERGGQYYESEEKISSKEPKFENLFDFSLIKINNIIINAISASMFALMQEWRQEFPEEHIDEDYMKSEMERNFTFYSEIPIENSIGWLEDKIKHKNISSIAYKLPFSTSKFRHGCYYNSLDVVRKHYNEGYELAFGITIEKKKINEMEKDPNRRIINPFTMHSFIVKNGKVYDPTLGTNDEDFYIWEIVPKQVWEKFSFIENDKNYDARQYFDYTINKIKEHSPIKIKIEDRLNEFPDYYNKTDGLPKLEDKLKKGIITKTKIYVEDLSSAPKGVKVQEGERGGLYYESTSSQELPSQDNIDFYEDDGILQIRHNNNFIGEIDYLPILEGIGKIKNINIKSEARGQGWGKKLLDKLEEKFQNNGAKKIITSSVTPKAEEFWNKMGYKQIENTRNWSKELIELKPITKTN